MYNPKLVNSKGHRRTATLMFNQNGGRNSTSVLRWMIGGASCLGISLVLVYSQFESMSRRVPWEQPQEEVRILANEMLTTKQISDDVFAISKPHLASEAPEKVLSMTRLADLIPRRRNVHNAEAIANDQDETQTLITDTDGTWVIVNTQDFTDSDGNTWIPATQEVSYSETTTTTWSTTVLTNLIIVSWRTKTETTMQDRFTTVTITGKVSAEDPGATTLTTTIDPSTIVTTTTDPSATTQATDNPQPSSSYIPSTTSPLPEVCPYSTCAPTCPWNTCSIKPTVMSPELCQMVDPCWNRKDKPPSQGDKCACLCESGYCSNKLTKCAEMNCCHECGCYLDDPMSLQRGFGKC